MTNISSPIVKSEDFAVHSESVGNKYWVTVKHIPTGRSKTAHGIAKDELRRRLLCYLIEELLQDGEI